MSAFEVYMVMQASNISMTSCVVAFGALFLGAFMVSGFFLIDETEEKRRTGKKLIIAGLGLMAFSAVFPSTQTLAAMYVLPTITSDEWQQEYSEIYDLAKEALKETLSGDKE